MQKKIIIICLVALVILSALAARLFIFSNHDEVVATTEKDIIAKPEFVVYFLGQISVFEQRGGMDIWDMDFDGETPENVAKHNTLDNIIMVKECVRQAKKMNIILSAEDFENASKNAELFYARLTEEVISATSISVDGLTEIMLENAYYSKVYNEVTENYYPQEQEISDFAEAYVDEAGETIDSEAGVELYKLAEDYYISQARQEYFMSLYNQWIENLTVDINDSVFNNITISDFK